MKKSALLFIAAVFVISSNLLYSDTDEINSLLDNSKRVFIENKTEEGLSLLDKAAGLAEAQKDANGCLSVGSAYAELPNEFDRKIFAVDILKKGAGFAKNKKNYLILGNIAELLKVLGEKDTAIDIYDDIFLYASELKDKDAIVLLKTKYEELGDEERVELCDKIIDALSMPPENWQPLGETVRQPKDTPDIVQQSQRSLADQEVQSTMEYLREKKKLQEEKKRNIIPAAQQSNTN